MKAIVLDIYGVIVKQTGDDFVPLYNKHLLTSVLKRYIFLGLRRILEKFLLTIEKLGVNAED